MILSLVVAASENNVIGNRGKLPWKLPNDLKHFREVTTGKPVIMGRKTYESIGHPLKDRQNIVISRQKDLQIEGCAVVSSLEDAICLAEQSGAEHACVIGGGEIYRQALPLAHKIELTRVHATIDGDAFFPSLDSQEWKEVRREDHPSDTDHIYPYSFILYERQKQ